MPVFHHSLELFLPNMSNNVFASKLPCRLQVLALERSKVAQAFWVKGEADARRSLARPRLRLHATQTLCLTALSSSA